MTMKEKELRGQPKIVLHLPNPGEDLRPHIDLVASVCDIVDGFVSPPHEEFLCGIYLDLQTVEAIYRWKQQQYDMEDIDSFIEEIRAGEREAPEGVSVAWIEARKNKLRQLYRDFVDENGEWDRRIQQAIETYIFYYGMEEES